MEPETFINNWIKKFVEFNLSFKIFYLGAVSFFTFLLDLIFKYFKIDASYNLIPYGFFLLFFFFWSTRIVFSNLRSDYKGSLSRKESVTFSAYVFIFLLLLNLWFLGSPVSFFPVLIILGGFSATLYLLFVLLKKFALERSEVHIYFGMMAIASSVNILIYLITVNLIK